MHKKTRGTCEYCCDNVKMLTCVMNGRVERMYITYAIGCVFLTRSFCEGKYGIGASLWADVDMWNMQ